MALGGLGGHSDVQEIIDMFRAPDGTFNVHKMYVVQTEHGKRLRVEFDIPD